MTLFNKDQFDRMNEQALDEFLKRHKSPITIGMDIANSGEDYSVTKHTGWIVLQRLQLHDGKPFIAPTFCETKPEADLYASNFHNIVAIMPIEWEE